MKRWLAVLLSVALMLICPALAEESASDTVLIDPEPPEPTLSDTLAEWASKLDPSQYDVSATFNTLGAEFSSLLRQDDQRIELDIPGVCKLQACGTQLALSMGDQVYLFDAQPILEAIQESQNSVQAASEDLTLLSDALQRAVDAVLLPSVSVENSYSGSSLHIELDRQSFLERLNSFVEAELASDDFARLFDAFAPMLRMSVADFPESPEALREAWPNVYRILTWTVPVFSIDADMTASAVGRGRQTVTCAGRLTYAMGRGSFSFDFAEAYDGFSLSAAWDGYGVRGNDDISLSLDAHGQRLTGLLLVDEGDPISFALDATFQESGVYAEVTTRQDGALAGVLALNVFEDTDSRHVYGTLDYTDYSYSEASTQNLVDLSLDYWDGGFSGSVHMPGESFHFRGGETDSYARFTLRSVPDDSYTSAVLLDAWLFNRGFNSYGYRFEYMETVNRRRVQEISLSGSVSPSAFSFDYSQPQQHVSASGEAHCVTNGDDFDFGFRFLQDESYYYSYNMAVKQPNRFNLSRKGDVYTVEITDCDLYRTVAANAQFALDEAEGLAWLEGDYAVSYARYPEDDTSAHLSFTPEKTVITTGDGEIVVERAVATDHALVYRVTSSPDGTEYELGIELDETASALTGFVRVADFTVARLVIAAGERTAIEPIDTSDANYVNLFELYNLLTAEPEVPEPEYIEDAPAEEPAAEEPAVEEPAVEDIPVEEAAVEDIPVEEPAAN